MGSTSYRWKNLYVKGIDAYTSHTYPMRFIVGSDHITLKGLYNGSNHLPYIEIRDENDVRAFYLGWGSKSAKIVDWRFENNYYLKIDGLPVLIVNSSIRPIDDGNWDIGSSAHKWRNGYFSNLLYSTYQYVYAGGHNYLYIGDTIDLLLALPQRHNILRYKIPSSIEYYDYDTETWTTWDISGEQLVDGFYDRYITIDYEHRTFRITWYGVSWCHPIALVYHIHHSGTGYSRPVTIKVETSSDGSSWTLRKEYTLPGGKYQYIIPLSDWGGDNYVRITFDIQLESGETWRLNEVEILSMRTNWAGDKDYPIPVDGYRRIRKSIEPSSNNAYDLGSGSYKWKNIYAVNIYGDTIYEGNTALSDKYAPKSHTHTRDEITDFWNTPFWDNIPDKPSEYPPEAHTHTRSEITDFWDTPFWDNIPDKPSEYPPEAHTHDASDITSGTLSLDRLPLIPYTKLDTTNTPSDGQILSYSATDDKMVWIDPPSGGDLEAHRTATPIDHPDGSITTEKIADGAITDAKISDVSRSKITDFWDTPFWDNIPDKPSTFPPEAHASSHEYGGTDLVTNLDHLKIRGTTVITTGRVLKNIASIAQTLKPSADATYDLGNSSYKWRRLYLTKSLLLGTTSEKASITLGSYIDTGDGLHRYLIIYDDYDAIIGKEQSSYGTAIRFYGSVEILLGGFYPGIGWDKTILKINCNTNEVRTRSIKPFSNNTYLLGDSTYKWKAVYTVNLYTGDIVLDNGWKIVETENGVAIINTNGVEIFKITDDGLYYKGKRIR